MRKIVFTGLALAVLAGCADPLRDVPKLSELDVAEDAGKAQALAPSDTPLAQTRSATTPSTGVLGMLQRAADSAKDSSTTTTAAVPTLAAAKPDPLPRRSKRLRANAPDALEVAAGTRLPYGQLARLCGANRQVLGNKVATYPEARGKFTLHDTKPGSTAQRTFFVTGFDDGCARQFTAALAMFGSPVMHEQLRYGLPSKVQPFSTTDEAYETLKQKVCRVGKGKPCGNSMRRLERTTTFLAVYERFGSNPRWKTVLLHDGEVLAADIKD